FPIALFIPSAMLVTILLPASLKRPKKFLTVLQADVIPFETALLTLPNALDTIPGSELNIFDIVFLMPFTILDIVLLIPFQMFEITLRIAFMTVLIIFLMKLKPVDTTFLAAFTPLVNIDLTVFQRFATIPLNPVNSACPNFKILPTNHNWTKFHTS